MILNSLYQAIDRVWQWISGLVFVRFEFDMQVDEIKRLDKEGRLIFCCIYGGFIEWLILTSWCRKQGLNAILVANRLNILLFAKPLYFFQVLLRQRSYAQLYLEHQTGPRVLFCPSSERKQLFEPTEVEALLADIYRESNITGEAANLHFVPVFICWRRHLRGIGRPLTEFLFGLSSNPNWIGKIWYLVRRRNDSTVRALAPFTFSAKEAQEGHDSFDETDSLRIARSTRRKILIAVNQEMRVVLGPRYFSAHSIKETLMRDPEIQKAIDQVSAEKKMDRKKVMALAYQNLSEISSNYRFRFIEVMYVFLSWLFTKVFDGMESRKEDLQKVREVMKTKPVVFVACHRSHLDYLVLPYLLFLEDMVTPHIVAGVNLAFWPIGPFLRRGGAFFIRRAFRGDILYSVCLRKYIEFLVKSRINVKFFIEGTRSRTGKMLPPAYGILKMVMESYGRKVVDDIALVPVSICYDEVFEEGAYTKELAGAKKEKESAKSLLKSRSLVKKNIGKVYVRFADPLFAKDIYQNAENLNQDATLTLQKTAFQLCKAINDVTPVTPKSVVCSVLLSHEKAVLSLEDILRASDTLAQYVEYSSMDLSTEFGFPFKRTVEKTVRSLGQSGVLLASDTSPLTYQLDPKQRTLLNFYKNNGIHCLVTPSITLLAILAALTRKNPDAAPLEAISKEALRIRGLLKFEFFFSPTHIFSNEILSAVKFFLPETDISHLDQEKILDGLRRRFSDPSDISVFQRLIGDLLESYLTTAQCIKQSEAKAWDPKSLTQKILQFSESKLQDQELLFPESRSIQNISNGIKLFENRECVSIDKDGDKTVIRKNPSEESLDKLIFELTELIRLMHEPTRSIFLE